MDNLAIATALLTSRKGDVTTWYRNMEASPTLIVAIDLADGTRIEVTGPLALEIDRQTGGRFARMKAAVSGA